METLPPQKTNAEPTPYLRIWRWHFFAGLFLSPTLISLSLTGLVYLFKPQAEPALYRKWLEVPPAVHNISAQAQLDSALTAFPKAKIQSITPSSGPGKTMQVFLQTNSGEPLITYVNPHDGSVVGSQRSDRTLMQIAHDLHGSLLLGEIGEVWMELTAGWALILVATGLFLWWPKGRGGGGVFWPRLHLKGRALLKDLHAVPAFYASALIILFLCTGIPWTGITGKWISQFAAATDTGSPPGFGGSPLKSEAADGRAPVALDALIAMARERLPRNAAFQIVLPKKPDGAAVIRWKAPRPQDRAYIHVDNYSGKILADYRWKDFGVIGKLTLMSVALHEGTWFGAWNQALNSFVALSVLGLTITGLWIWCKRRPPDAGFGAPQAPDQAQMPATLWAIIALCCCLVPITALSLAAILGLDFAARKFFMRKAEL